MKVKFIKNNQNGKKVISILALSTLDGFQFRRLRLWTGIDSQGSLDRDKLGQFVMNYIKMISVEVIFLGY